MPSMKPWGAESVMRKYRHVGLKASTSMSPNACQAFHILMRLRKLTMDGLTFIDEI